MARGLQPKGDESFFHGGEPQAFVERDDLQSCRAPLCDDIRSGELECIGRAERMHAQQSASHVPHLVLRLDLRPGLCEVVEPCERLGDRFLGQQGHERGTISVPHREAARSSRMMSLALRPLRSCGGRVFSHATESVTSGARTPPRRLGRFIWLL